jgi:hypothetical protein
VNFNPYDVATKELVWEEPSCWLPRLRIDPTLPLDVIESGITTLTASADKVIRIGAPTPFLLILEFQGAHVTDLARTLWFRQVALDYQHDLPVLTALILLRKEANSPSLTGVYERQVPDGRATNRYHYEVVRLWEEDPDFYLAGSITLVPLEPLTAVAEPELPGLIRRMRDRIEQEPPLRAEKLWGASYLLMGLRYSDELVDRLFEGVRNMKESTTYQKILREGREEGREEGRIAEARRFLIVLGTERLGEPDEACMAVLETIESVERLEGLGRRMITDPTVANWGDLLR